MKCTGRNCPMQIGAVNPAYCLADKCPYITKLLTNADRIRAMSDEELAMICEDGCPPNYECPPIKRKEIGEKSACQQCWLDWLKTESRE